MGGYAGSAEDIMSRVQRCSSPSSELARKASCVVQTGAVCMFETGVLGRVSGLYSPRSAYVAVCVSWDTTNRQQPPQKRRVVLEFHLFFIQQVPAGFAIWPRCETAAEEVLRRNACTNLCCSLESTARVFPYRLHVITKVLNLVAAVFR